MKRNKEIRAAARQAMNGHWGWAILVCLIFGAIIGAVSAPSGIVSALGGNNPALLALSLSLSSATFLITLFGLGPLEVGYFNSFSRYYKNADFNTVGNMFSFGFAGGRYWRNVLGSFLVRLFTGLWTLLFIIPGIIKSYAYSLTNYILVDNPELGPNEARLKSIEMMRGYKWKLFGLDLSFIGWILLCILSLGIGFIWLAPYMQTAHAAFYHDLKEELNPQPATEETTAE